MKHLRLLILCAPILWGSCAAWQHTLISTGNRNDAVNNAVTDFLRSNLSKKGDTFIVYFADINEDVIALGIGSSDFKVWVYPEDTIGSHRIFTRHLIKDGKLFYWDDPDYGLTQEMIDALVAFDHVDSTNFYGQVAYPSYGINEKEKGADYYFCKDDLTNYKRVITNIAIGWYDPPKLRCKRK